MNFLSLFKRSLIYKLRKKTSIDKQKLETKSLDELFQFYGSDKGELFLKANSKGHGYSKFYIEKLNHLKNKKINILEIGSFAGSSAAAFSKYFKNSNIFCFDINISNFEFESKQINVYGLDINNIKKVKKTLSKIYQSFKFNSFDLIIDDGSHKLKDILIGLKLFFNHLSKNGIYIIEDFKHPNYYEYNNDIDHIFLEEFLNNIRGNKLINSNIFNELDQKYLIKSIKNIDIKKGKLEDSDICFIEKI